jgi:hypothetical protein
MKEIRKTSKETKEQRDWQTEAYWQTKQSRLFNMIKAKIPKGAKPVTVIEEDLNTSADSVYRKIRCNTELTFHEFCHLCTEYRISADEIIGCMPGKNMSYMHLAIDLSDNNSYMEYLQQSCDIFTDILQPNVDNKFSSTAADIPFYYFPNYPDLLYFKLYERYCKMTEKDDIYYEDFCEQLDKDKIMPLLAQIAELHMQTPSTEIWCDHTIDRILLYMKYCVEAKCFAKEETVFSLLEQLSALITTVEKEADSGKRINTKKSFKLYIYPIEIEENIIMIQNGDKFDCNVRLFTANNFLYRNYSTCHECHQEINALISKSFLISVTLKKERSRFFQTMQTKISDLTMELKIEN